MPDGTIDQRCERRREAQGPLARPLGVRLRLVARVAGARQPRGAVRALHRRRFRGAPLGRIPDHDRPVDRGAAGGGLAGRAGGRRHRGRGGPGGVRKALVSHPSRRARQVPLPHRADPPGARARVRRARVVERRQAHQGVARRGRAARRSALLLLRRLGGQARVRLPERPAEAAGRRRAGDPVELPAADAGLEDRARPRRRQHGRSQAGGDDPADGPALHRRAAPGRAAGGCRQHRDRRRAHRRRPRQAPRRRQGRLHRLDRGRKGDPARAGRRRRSA